MTMCSGAVTDNLTYNYSTWGNRLFSVEDASTNNNGVKTGTSSFGYDNNGNMTADGTKGAAISYNLLNLPAQVVLSSPSRTVQYTYDASGSKLKMSSPSAGTLYAGAFEYTVNGTLLRIGLEEGQLVRNSSGTYELNYYIRDHMGNVRQVLKEEQVLQQTQYYAFGLPVVKDGNDAANKYLYNGKEKQPETGWLDYGARMYMAEIGRWGAVDPAGAVNYSQSPFHYVLNNPFGNIDPYGLWEESATGYSTSDKDDIRRYLSYINFERKALGNKPSSTQMIEFVKGELSGTGLGVLSNGGKLISEINEVGYRSSRGVDWYADRQSVSRAWHEVQGNYNPDALDTRTLGHNIFWKTYPGPDNPKTYRGDDDYSYRPSNIIEYPGMYHDKAYDKKQVKGAAGLFFSTKVIGDDWRFVGQELMLANNPALDPVSRFQARIFATGLGLAATPKTAIYFLWKGVQGLGKGASAVKP